MQYFGFTCKTFRFLWERKMGSLQEPWVLENVDSKGTVRHGKTAINMSSSLLRTKSDLPLVSRVRCPMLRHFLANLHEVVLGTKLSLVFPVIPLAFVAHFYGFGRVSSYFSFL